MKKNITSLYAGKIEIAIVGERITPKSITIKKSIETVTDTFTFVVPMVSNERDRYFIPNIFGLEVDVYVNDEFYVGGILINRTVSGTEIKCECSTHGWQLTTSEIYQETIYKGEEIGKFIGDVCNKNFKISYEVVKAAAATTPTLNFVKGGECIRDEIPGFCMPRITIENEEIQLKYEKRTIHFAIYDPFALGKTKISLVTNNDKGITAKYEQTVFDYIKSITNNSNIFIKCIGLLDQIKDNLFDRYLYNKPESTSSEESFIVYVLMIFRPGIDADLSSKRITTHYAPLTTMEKDIWANSERPQTKAGYKYFTNEYLVRTGYVTNDGTENSNCLQDPEENFNGMNEYTTYMLRVKNSSEHVSTKDLLEEKDRKSLLEATELMREKRQYFDVLKYNNVNFLGTLKNITIDRSLGEEYMKKRLVYELNKIRAESYNIKATVIGYTMDSNFKDVNYCEGKENIFWDFNRKVIVNSPSQGIINRQLIVGELEMNYDTSKGAYTNLKLIPPQSYSSFELGELSMEKQTTQVLVSEKFGYYSEKTEIVPKHQKAQGDIRGNSDFYSGEKQCAPLKKIAKLGENDGRESF